MHLCATLGINERFFGRGRQSLLPVPLPPKDPTLSPACNFEQSQATELAFARLSGVTGLATSADWLLYGAIRKEVLLTPPKKIDGTQATLADLFDDEAGLDIKNADDIEEVTNYMQAFRFTRENLRD